jgi:hypothetical protein
MPGATVCAFAQALEIAEEFLSGTTIALGNC